MSSFRTLSLKEFRKSLNKAFNNVCANLVETKENSSRYYRLLEIKNRLQDLYPLSGGPNNGELHLSIEDCRALFGPDSEGVLKCIDLTKGFTK